MRGEGGRERRGIRRDGFSYVRRVVTRMRDVFDEGIVSNRRSKRDDTVASLATFDRKNWKMEIPGNRNGVETRGFVQRESISLRIEGIFKY